MKGQSISIALAAIAAAAITPASAQGPIHTMQHGHYMCELPANAAQRGLPQPEQSFSIESASQYSSPQGSGTYLRRGNTLTFTSGARQGDTYHLVSENFLRKQDGGKPSRLRCVRGSH